MKLTVKTKALLRACQFAAKSLKPNSPLPALSHLLMVPEGERLTIIGSDLETTSSMMCEADISDPQRFCVPASRLINLLGSSTGENCQISMVKDRIHVEIGMSKSQMSTIPWEEFPPLQDISGDSVTMESKDLSRHLSRVIFAASKDHLNQYAMTGVNIEFSNGEIRFTASNGKVLSTSFQAGIGKGSITVPIGLISKVASASIESVGDVTIVKTEKSVAFRFEDCEVSGKLIDDNFPKWRQVIPKSFEKEVDIDRKETIESLKRCKLFMNDRFYGVRMEFNGTLTVTSGTPLDSFEDVLSCSACEPLGFDIDPEYLINIASRMEGDRITIHAIDSLSPIMVQEGDFMCITMCLRGKTK